MKMMLLILFFFLSLHSGDGVKSICIPEAVQEISEDSLKPSPESGIVSGGEPASALAQTSFFYGGAQTSPVSFRSSGSSDGGHSSARYSSRMPKAGKTSYVNSFRSFMIDAVLAQSGRLSSDRYLFSICRLRL